jgi:hypothetical protein
MSSLFVILLALLKVGDAQKACSQPVWTMDLVTEYQFRPFEPPKPARDRMPERWRTQQGAVFVSTEVLALYQVAESKEAPPLASRDKSGGAGKFALRVEFIDVANRKHVRSLRLSTSGSGFSQLYPLHHGKFLIRTGELMRVYSETFEELATRQLPLSGNPENESWTIAVPPNGDRIYLQHMEFFGAKQGSRTQRYLIDPDSLQTVASLDSTNPSGWPPSDAASNSLELPQGSISQQETLISVETAGSLIAGEVHGRFKSDPFDRGLSPKHMKIVVYDATTKSQVCSLSIATPVSTWPSARFYAISQGALAVIQGPTLTVYGLEESTRTQ